MQVGFVATVCAFVLPTHRFHLKAEYCVEPHDLCTTGFRLNFFPRGRIANTSWGIIAPYSHPAIVNTSLRATIEHEMEHLSSAKEPSCSQTESGAALGDGTIKDARDETAHVIQPRLFTDSHPGDVLFIPGGWWYASVALSPTVAVEHKFSCSSANTAAVLAELKKRGQVEGAVRRCADAMRRATSQTRKKTQPRENLRENQGPIKSRNTRSNSAERPKHSSPRSQEPFSGASMSPGTGNAFSETDFADEMKSRGMQQMKIGDDLLYVNLIACSLFRGFTRERSPILILCVATCAPVDGLQRTMSPQMK